MSLPMRFPSQGTPPDLKRAIMDGLIAATKRAGWNAAQQARFNELRPEAQKVVAAEVQAEQISIIENRILDRLRQDFGIAYLELDDAVSAEECRQIVYRLAKRLRVEK